MTQPEYQSIIAKHYPQAGLVEVSGQFKITDPVYGDLGILAPTVAQAWRAAGGKVFSQKTSPVKGRHAFHPSTLFRNLKPKGM